MTQIPQQPIDDTRADDLDELKQNQGYQDDIDTSQRDQFANETGSDPSDDTAATKVEFRQGLRDSQGPDQEGGSDAHPAGDSEPPLASDDDLREEFEGRGKDGADVGGDDKSRDFDTWK